MAISSSVKGAIVINPAGIIFFDWHTKSIECNKSSKEEYPDFESSAVWYSKRTLTCFPSFSACFSISCKSSIRSTDWIQEAQVMADLTLLRCKEPIIWSSAEGWVSLTCWNFAVASWTRFSPNNNWPQLMASITACAGWNLLTATSLTEPGFLPALFSASFIES